jgi:hypothetical protein
MGVMDCLTAAFGWSDPAGEAPCWEPKDAVPLGEAECDDGVCRFLGDRAEGWACIGGGSGDTGMPGSSFGAMPDADLRAWCLFKMARWMGGGCTRFWGTWVGPRFGLPVFARSSACTSMPASRWCQ